MLTCETCNNRKMKNPGHFKRDHAFCKVSELFLYGLEQEFIDKVGCCSHTDRQIPDIVYLVGIGGYDMDDVRYICTSEKKAEETFEVLRAELIQRCKDMIEHCKEDEADFPGCSDTWVSDMKELTEMKNGDLIHGDSPYILSMPITRG